MNVLFFVEYLQFLPSFWIDVLKFQLPFRSPLLFLILSLILISSLCTIFHFVRFLYPLIHPRHSILLPTVCRQLLFTFPLLFLILFFSFQLLLFLPQSPKILAYYTDFSLSFDRKAESIRFFYPRFIETNLSLLGPSAVVSQPSLHPTRIQFYNPKTQSQIIASYQQCMTSTRFYQSQFRPLHYSYGSFFDLQDQLTLYRDFCFEQASHPFRLPISLS